MKIFKKPVHSGSHYESICNIMLWTIFPDTRTNKNFIYFQYEGGNRVKCYAGCLVLCSFDIQEIPDTPVSNLHPFYFKLHDRIIDGISLFEFDLDKVTALTDFVST
jgi:hypothetical protein